MQDISGMPMVPDWVGDDIDPNVPSIARMYDYCLGGSHNFTVDREMVEKALAVSPQAVRAAHANRAFLRRAVTYCAGQGITQFLDIGSGIPTAGNVHEILAALGVPAQVVYTDIDPVAVLMSRRLLAGINWATALRGDFRDLDGLCESPEVTARIDFDKPVAVLVVAVLNYVNDIDTHEAIARLRDRLASGSHLVISVGVDDDGGAVEKAELAELLRRTPTAPALMNTAQARAYFDGFRMVEPGLVKAPYWRPELGASTETTIFDPQGGVGVKP